MTDLTYTDDDLRALAAKLQAQAALDAEGRIRSAVEHRWAGKASDEQIDEACDELVSLLDSAVDMSAWSVNLGARYLKTTTELAWGRGGDAWDLAVQIAHRPGLSTELREALTGAIRGAVNHVLHDRGIDDTHLLHQHTSEETSR
ncbi:hypothetical protein [Streptomyces azureus]|uniref:Alpha/beta hydrolase fold protein n=1 Tax=Streptomyces azureus TaxID=146537 RepID=A0A0K8PHR0_STRAJ|nr:hypothetical protein [Streptomyces azureus]GAP46929.1 alpha/beta hydrolase fold protein [Streptomyces azureus]